MLGILSIVSGLLTLGGAIFACYELYQQSIIALLGAILAELIIAKLERNRHA